MATRKKRAAVALLAPAVPILPYQVRKAQRPTLLSCALCADDIKHGMECLFVGDEAACPVCLDALVIAAGFEMKHGKVPMPFGYTGDLLHVEPNGDRLNDIVTARVGPMSVHDPINSGWMVRFRDTWDRLDFILRELNPEWVLP